MARLVYDEKFFDGTAIYRGDDTTGFVPAIIAAAPGIIGVISGLFGGGQKAQCQGLAGINACGQQAVQSMQQILAGLQNGQIQPQQAVSNAQQIVNDFNNPSIVYPAKKGNDAAARQQFIVQLGQLNQQVQAIASQITAQQQQAAASGQTIDPVTGQATGGISTNTLLLVGGGLVAIFLLTSQRQ